MLSTNLLSKGLTWVSVAAILALSAFSIKLTLDNQGLRLEISKQETKLSKLQTESAEKLAAQQAEARLREGALLAQMTLDKEQTNETIAQLTDRAATLSASLRDAKRAAERAAAVRTAATVAAAPETQPGSDRPLVPAEIGEPDVAEALRADTIRVELLRCYAAYDRAADELARFLQPQ